MSDKLAYMIHTGLLRPGDVLPSERELAATLEVSRETVRAAIGVLEARRMVTVNQGARTSVLGPGPFPLHEAVSTWESRSLIDGSCRSSRDCRVARIVKLVATRIRAKQLVRLEKLVRSQESMLDDPVRFQISDRMFHTTLYEACGNTLLVDVVSDFYDYALEYRRLALQRPGAIAHSVAEHRAIVDSLKRSPEAAVEAARRHLKNSS